MADVLPLRALHFDPATAGDLQDLVAPPYDVIDPAQREQLAGRAPHNVVRIDLPDGDDPYATAADLLAAWREQGAVVRDDEPAFWAIAQDYTGPDGKPYTRRGFFARVRIEDYGPGRIRPHERTHPGPKEDRLRLTRATRANLSPIFSLYDDPELRAWRAIEPHTASEPWADVTDEDGTHSRVWRVPALSEVTEALAEAELLIADGHHRYETARVYREEMGGEGAHDFVLMCLVALQDEGLTIFPTHRLLTGLDDARREALRDAVTRDWDAAPSTKDDIEPPTQRGPIQVGYLDGFHDRPLRLTLKDQAIADAALEGMPAAYRRLDTAVLEALILQQALGMTEDDISHLNGLDYSRNTPEALEMIRSGSAQAGFFMGAVPVELVREIAAAGEVMPPKSTYFFPKVPTGLLFHPLDEQ